MTKATLVCFRSRNCLLSIHPRLKDGCIYSFTISVQASKLPPRGNLYKEGIKLGLKQSQVVEEVSDSRVKMGLRFCWIYHASKRAWDSDLKVPWWRQKVVTNIGSQSLSSLVYSPIKHSTWVSDVVGRQKECLQKAFTRESFWIDLQCYCQSAYQEMSGRWPTHLGMCRGVARRSSNGRSIGRTD